MLWIHLKHCYVIKYSKLMFCDIDCEHGLLSIMNNFCCAQELKSTEDLESKTFFSQEHLC
jgi:hypothetical protein